MERNNITSVIRVTTLGIGAIASSIKTRSINREGGNQVEGVVETIPSTPEVYTPNQSPQQTTTLLPTGSDRAYIWKYKE